MLSITGSLWGTNPCGDTAGGGRSCAAIPWTESRRNSRAVVYRVLRDGSLTLDDEVGWMDESSRRRSDRILAPIRIRVIGNDATGTSFAEETVTVTFSQHGARISLTHSLLSDDV